MFGQLCVTSLNRPSRRHTTGVSPRKELKTEATEARRARFRETAMTCRLWVTILALPAGSLAKYTVLSQGSGPEMLAVPVCSFFCKVFWSNHEVLEKRVSACLSAQGLVVIGKLSLSGAMAQGQQLESKGNQVGAAQEEVPPVPRSSVNIEP